MSKLGKILLYIAVVGALADVAAAYLSWNKFGADQAVITTTQTDRDTYKKQVVLAKQKADDATKAAADAQTQLTEQKAKVDDLTAKLGDAQKSLNDANTAVSQAQATQKGLQDQLDHVKSVLGDMTPEQATAAIKTAQDALATNQSEQKILQDQLQAAQANVDELKKDINASKVGIIPPGVSGKVTFVNRAWNFVVLNVGLANGVVPNGTLIIYRGRDFLGKVKVTSAETNSAVADILPDAKADIQVGDDVLN
jgi:vacuolar-type H+-ATPase subunit I/STV1